jgi:hypothetical protein
MTIKFKFENGIKVQDKISGITGIIEGAAMWINGCKKYSIQPRVKDTEDNKIPDSWWIDEQNLEKIDDGIITKKKTTHKALIGGPTFCSTHNK